MRRVNMLYTPDELKEVLKVLGDIIQETRRAPEDIVKALHDRGYRIVKAGRQ